MCCFNCLPDVIKADSLTLYGAVCSDHDPSGTKTFQHFVYLFSYLFFWSMQNLSLIHISPEILGISTREAISSTMSFSFSESHASSSRSTAEVSIIFPLYIFCFSSIRSRMILFVSFIPQ